MARRGPGDGAFLTLAALLGGAALLWARQSSLPEAIDYGDGERAGLWDEIAGDAAIVANRIAGAPAAAMQPSAALAQLLQGFESLSLTPYRLDGESGYTLGWGRFYPDSGQPPPASITREQADAWFWNDIEARGAKWVRAYVTVPVTQSQFDALVSMAYNMSPKSFRTIAEVVNRGEDPEDAAMVFVRPGSKYERGLRIRRGQELALYRSEGIASIDGGSYG